jgi:hypothetical protein
MSFMHRICSIIGSMILITLFALTSLSFGQQLKPVVYPDDPIYFKKQFIERLHIRDRNFTNPGNPTITDWQSVIDSTWGWGEPKAEKLRIFDLFWETIDHEFPCFNGIVVNWDSLRTFYRAEIDTGNQTYGVSRGRFAGMMHHLAVQLQESHTNIDDKTVSWYTELDPGIPLLHVGAWGDNSHFGAGLTLLEDSTLLVYKAIPNHPLGLVPGDIVRGYNGVPWKDLYPQLLQAQLPMTGNWWGSSPSSYFHSWMIAAGLNWHLADTIDIVKYSSGDTLHLPTDTLLNMYGNIWCTEQMDIPGVPMPNYLAGERASYGIIQGTQIGYIYVVAWSGNVEQEFYDAVYDLMFNHQTTGLIIDFRTNYGGNMFLSDQALTLLFNTNVLTIDFAERCNPDDHFTLCPLGIYQYYVIHGSPSTYYDKPIAVLTGPGALSSGDQVAYRFKFHPMARFFGKSTSTAFNAPELLDIGNNSWSCAYARYEAHPYLNIFHWLTHRELEVNEEVWLTPDDVAQGNDTVVDAAIEWINSYTGLVNDSPLPRSLRSLTCYPNPFNASTTIEFSLPEAAHVELSVYNVLGQKVAILLDGQKEAGKHVATWDAAVAPSGKYFVRLESGPVSKTLKTLLLK